MFKEKGAVKREKSILFAAVNSLWYPLGEDNESMTRTRNNAVSQVKNILGKSKATVSSGNQITSVDPYKITSDNPLSAELYEIDRKSKELDELKYNFMEVSIFDEVEPGKYRAWTQDGLIDLKSWGGQNDGLYAPFDIVWTGERVQGVYDQALNIFTPSDSINTLQVVSTAGSGAGKTIITVAPAVGTGNHYRYKAGSTAQTVTANEDLSAWDVLAVGRDVDTTGETITIAEVDAGASAVKTGSTTVVYGS